MTSEKVPPPQKNEASQCNNCRHWQGRRDHDHVGECWRFPPTMRVNAREIGKTNEWAWCGEWEINE